MVFFINLRSINFRAFLFDLFLLCWQNNCVQDDQIQLSNFCFINFYSIEEECAISSCTSTLEAKNMELHKSFKCLTSVFNKLQSYVSLLASQSKLHYKLYRILPRYTAPCAPWNISSLRGYMGLCSRPKPCLVFLSPFKVRWISKIYHVISTVKSRNFLKNFVTFVLQFPRIISLCHSILYHTKI